MNHEELIGSLKKLRLPAMADEYVATARVAEKTKKTYEQYLVPVQGRKLSSFKYLHAFPLDFML